MIFRRVLPLFLALLACVAAPLACSAAMTPTEARADQFAAHNTTTYSLPPDKMRKAQALTRIWDPLTIAEEVWTAIALALILTLGVASRLRDLVVRISRNRWTQGAAFVFLLLLIITLVNLPFNLYGHHTSLVYGFSVQGWASWLGDKGKTFLISWGLGTMMTMALVGVISWSPRRWWLWFWMVSVVFIVAGVFMTPYVIDPLFNKFEPLTRTNPALVERLEQVVARGGIAIPPERMFLMQASAKVTTLNAYVTGFGASKRVVVWDTTLAKATPDEISFIFAHEMGHYALGHIVIGTAFYCGVFLVFLWIGYHAVQILLRRFGAAWGIPSQNDWGALVVLALVVTVLSGLSDPLTNSFQRVLEHNADVYGQEAAHGIVADPQGVGRAAFQVLGEDSLDDPTPQPLFEFWFDTHPPIRYRAAFAEAYDPWAQGEAPKYFAK